MSRNNMIDLAASPLPLPGEQPADYRARILRRQAEDVEQRQQELSEQRSMLNTPEERIRIWERLHALALPKDPGHPLVRIIADNTGLTQDQVRHEQAQRTTAAA